MDTYLVTWTIEIDANSPREAAEEALRIHRDPNSIATVFRVAQWAGRMASKTIRIGTYRQLVTIDLGKEEPNV